MVTQTQDAETIFLAAIEKATPAERASFVDGACAGDDKLQQRVMELLVCHEATRGPLDAPPSALGIVGDLRIMSEEPNMVIGPYKLIEQIGEGGMATVWMAQQTSPVRRLVAVKLIKPGMDSKQVVARFEAERQALALMDHPNIARVLDGGMTSAGRPYFVMELVKGIPITKYCDEHHLEARQRLEMFIPVCHAIQHAHQKGIIHRDLKPTNVLVALYDGNPVPKVIDFGVAKATGQQLTDRTLVTGFGAIVGTLDYMSPEQANFNQLDVDTRSDIYSLGVLLYELLAGSPPFSRKELENAGMMEILRMIREQEPTKPSTKLSTAEGLPTLAANRGTEPAKLTKLVRGELDWIVMKALEKDRNRRYETANGLGLDITRYLADEPVLACPPTLGYRLWKTARKHRKMLVTVAAFALLLVAGVVVSVWLAIRATHAAEAEKEAMTQATKRLAQIEKGNEIITAIFADLDIRNVREEAVPLEAVLAKRLVQAADQLEGEAVGDPLVVAGLQERLGLSLLNLGHPQGAIPLFVKVRATRSAELGADHHDTLISMNNLALGYREDGKLDLALPLLEETLKLRKAKSGTDHPDTITCMNNLALGYREVGKLDSALPLFKATLELRKAKWGTDHPATLLNMHNLADSYRAAGKLDLALPLLEETLKLRKAKLGPDHTGTLMSMNALATGYMATGKLNMALPLFEETLKQRKVKLGTDHPNTLFSMNNLAEGYRAAGKLDLALPLYEETLKLRKVKLGADHHDTLTSMNNLAVGYQVAGKLDLALPLYQEAAAGIEKRHFKHEHVHLIIPNLCNCQELLKQYDQAEVWRRKWLAVVKERSGADSTAYAGELAALGLNLIQQQKWTETESILKECLAIRQKNATNAWTTFNTQSMLGSALVGQGKYTDAEPLLLAGYEGMRAREQSIPSRAKDLRLREALERIVRLYDGWGKKDKADEWRKKLAEQKQGKASSF